LNGFFVEEALNDPRLPLAAAVQMRSGGRDHLRLIVRPLWPNGLLGVLVEQLVCIEFSAIAWHEAESQHGLPLPLRFNLAGQPCRSMRGRRVDYEDDLPSFGGFQEPYEEANEDIRIEAAREHHKPQASHIADRRDHDEIDNRLARPESERELQLVGALAFNGPNNLRLLLWGDRSLCPPSTLPCGQRCGTALLVSSQPGGDRLM
jgi:hypothetical protein